MANHGKGDRGIPGRSGSQEVSTYPGLTTEGACRERAAIPSSEFLYIRKNRQILIPWIFPILCQK